MYITNFSDYINERTRNFTGREWVYTEINKWLANPDATRYFVITGEPGIGKTAIAARLTQICDLAAIHFCIARQADTIDPLNFARSISHQLTIIDGFAEGILEDKGVNLNVHIEVQKNLGSLIGVHIENLIAESRSAIVAFNRTVLEPIKKLYAKDFNKQLVILVDALDEAVQHQGSENIIDLIANAQGLPSQIRFILTSRPESAVLRHFEQQQIPHIVLDAGREENIKDVQEYILHRLEASEILHTRLKEKDIQSQTFINRVTAASQGNFLYLVWLIPAIENGTQRFDALEALPKGLDGIYRDFLRTRTIGKDIHQWRTIYRPVLGILAAAQAPLREETLARFAGIGDQDIADNLLDLQQFLDPMLAGQRQYRLYHQSITDFLCDKERAGEFWIDTVSVHQRIIAYYTGNAFTWEEVDWSQMDGYGLQYLSAHLYALRDNGAFRQELYRLICPLFMKAKHAWFGSHEFFTKDIALAIEAARSEKPSNIVQELRGIMINATFGSLATNMPAQVLDALTRLEQDVRATKFASLIINKDLQIQAFHLIGEALLDQKEMKKAKNNFIQSLMLAEKHEDKANEIKSLSEIAKALVQLGEKTKAIEIVNRALLEAEKIENWQSKADLLGEIAQILVQLDERVKSIEITNRALAEIDVMEDMYRKAKALNDIANVMFYMDERAKAIDITNRALAETEKIEDNYSKAKVTCEIAKLLAQLGERTKAIDITNRVLAEIEMIKENAYKGEGELKWTEVIDWSISGGICG